MQTKRTLVIETLGLTYKCNYGYQEYLFNILDYFHENRVMLLFDRIVIVSRNDNVSLFLKYRDKFEIKSYNCSNLFIKYIILNNLYESLHLFKQDVILFTNNYSSFRKKCKHVLVVHDLLYLRKDYMPHFLFRLQRHLFIPISIKLADKIIAISQWVKKDIEVNFRIKNKEKITFIYNYFNFKKFEFDEINSEIIALVNNKDFFLVVSSNSFHKNTITIFKAFAEFCKINDTIDLFCVGKISGNLENYYNHLCDNVKNRIIILDSISNASLGYIYKKTCGYISATLFEGLGMPIVEAMYFNAPVLVSDIEVVREVSLNQAIYFPPLDYLILTQLMKKVSSEEKNYNYKLTITDMFSEENTVNQYINVINELSSN